MKEYFISFIRCSHIPQLLVEYEIDANSRADAEDIATQLLTQQFDPDYLKAISQEIELQIR